MSTLLPAWNVYMAEVGEDHAQYMAETGMARGGLRIADLGDGRIALDEDAVQNLMRLIDDDDGVVVRDGDKLQLWISGWPYLVSPADGD
jgi:hypothetical protein